MSVRAPIAVQPAILALHGFLGRGADWEPVLARWPWPAEAPDLPGHGAPPCREPGLEGVAARLLAAHPRADTLLGYSMGGRIALATALLDPGRWRRLVLVGASPGIADPAERARRREWDEATAARLEAEGLEAFLGWWETLPVLAGHRRIAPALRAARRARALALHPAGLATSLRLQGTGRMTPLHARLGELAMPALWVVGEEDERYRAVAVRCAARMPRAEVLVVPGAGHAPHLERPDWFARRVGAWLGAEGPPRAGGQAPPPPG